MSFFMIIGRFGCKQYATAEYFAKHITMIIPTIQMKSQAFTENEYKIVLDKMRNVLRCQHTGSPMIWRDLEKIGECPQYIGGLSEFFDFCKEYYNVVMPRIDNQKDMENEHMEINLRETLKNAREKLNERGKRICITGAGNPAAGLLLLELLENKLLYADNYLDIRLHEDQPSKKEKLESLKWDVEGVECPDICKRVVTIKDNLYDAIKGCNLLIIMTEVDRDVNENCEVWLRRNYDAMKNLALRIDEVDVVTLNTIITGINLLCFNTAVLLKYSKLLDPHRTIAITSHVGLEALQYIANVSKLSANEIFGSPVWGFVGINQIVDTCHTKCFYCNWQIFRKPRQNRLKKHRSPLISFTEPPVIVEKRNLCFRTHTSEFMWQWVKSHKDCVKKTFGYQPYMSQINATLHVINKWLFNDFSKEIISAGIQSDGSYDIPKGIVFSQPIILEDGKWKIYSKQPVPHYPIKLRHLFPLPILICKKFSLVDKLPNIEESFLPAKAIERTELDIIEQQRKLREMRASMLIDIGVIDKEDDANEDDEDEEKAIERKNKIIEDLKNLRKEMKGIVESNPNNWFTKKMQKMKSEMEQEATKEETTKKPSVFEPKQEEKEEIDADEKKEVRKSEPITQVLEKLAADELQTELEKLDLIKVLGIVYANKILSRYENKVEPEEKIRKNKPKSLQPYKKICEALKDVGTETEKLSCN